MNRRVHSLSLSKQPEIRTYGGFLTVEKQSVWVQPADSWHVHWASYPGVFTLDSRAFTFPANSVIVVPPRAHCRVDRIVGTKFAYRFFAFVPEPSERDVVSFPVLTQLGEAQSAVYERTFDKAVRRVEWSNTSMCAFAYAFLWDLATAPSEAERGVDTYQAEAFIAAAIDRPSILREAAERLGVSSARLNEIFLEDHGCTAFQFLRNQRALAAHRMLTTTSEPVKVVAALCGMPDANSFARFVRQKFGVTPRELRKTRQNFDVFAAGDLRKKTP